MLWVGFVDTDNAIGLSTAITALDSNPGSRTSPVKCHCRA